MIRFLAVLACILLGLPSMASPGISDKVIEKLITCTPYRQEATVEVNGMTVTPIVIIGGEQHGKCMYQNYAKEYPDEKWICYFSKEQLKEIEQTYLKFQKDREAAFGTGKPVVEPMTGLFSKYFNDPLTCRAPEEDY